MFQRRIDNGARRTRRLRPSSSSGASTPNPSLMSSKTLAFRINRSTAPSCSSRNRRIPARRPGGFGGLQWSSICNSDSRGHSNQLDGLQSFDTSPFSFVHPDRQPRSLRWTTACGGTTFRASSRPTTTFWWSSCWEYDPASPVPASTTGESTAFITPRILLFRGSDSGEQASWLAELEPRRGWATQCLLRFTSSLSRWGHRCDHPSAAREGGTTVVGTRLAGGVRDSFASRCVGRYRLLAPGLRPRGEAPLLGGLSRSGN